MRSAVVLLAILAIGSSAPLQDVSNNRVQVDQEDALSTSGETEVTSGKSATKDSKSPEVLSLLGADAVRGGKASRQERHRGEGGRDKVKKGRKHKALFVNYPFLGQLPFGLPGYDLDYTNEYDSGVEQRTRAGSNRYQESNIFYIRLPPTPYMFVPGLGYISQPPTYSTAGLRPQLSQYVRPATRPRPHYHQASNPFIKLPIDFVSNGKPTSVYQWQKKPSKKPPADSPITNLDNLSADFVSNGKPTSIYQWQAGLKPAKRPDDSPNNLDKGPYAFNGKPTSFYLLKPDGTATGHQSIRYHDYQPDRSSYY